MLGNLKRKLIALIVTGIYSGYSPVAPGTAGTITAIIALYGTSALFNIELSQNVLVQLSIAIVVIGTITVSSYLQNPLLRESQTRADPRPLAHNSATFAAKDLADYNAHLDPKEVVIDEWAGIFIAFSFASELNTLSIFVLFIFFRFFDASKIGPVGWLERLPGAFGVMADDIIAGALAGVAYQVVITILELVA